MRCGVPIEQAMRMFGPVEYSLWQLGFVKEFRENQEWLYETREKADWNTAAIVRAVESLHNTLVTLHGGNPPALGAMENYRMRFGSEAEALMQESKLSLEAEIEMQQAALRGLFRVTQKHPEVLQQMREETVFKPKG